PDVVQGLTLDLDRQPRFLRPLYRRGDAAAETQVVVLDQHGVVEAETVVRPAAGAHGQLLESTEAGWRLARVEDDRTRSRDGIDLARGQRRDPGEPAEQVERGALTGEERAGAAGDPGHLALDRVAVAGDRLEVDTRVELAEHGLDELETAEDASFLDENR